MRPARWIAATLLWLLAGCSLVNPPLETRPEDSDCDGGTCSGVPDSPCAACSPFATCELLDGGVRCSCESGDVDVHGDGTVCESPQPCSDRECGPGRVCGRVGDAIACVCAEGYERMGMGSACSDIDECARGLDDCGEYARCVDEEGGFSCECEQGYVGDGRRCEDVDECGGLRCGEHAFCEFVPGLSECRCEPGYDGNPRAGCADSDECAQGLLQCPAQADCNPLAGPDRCVCRGYYTDVEGDGSVCAEDRITLALLNLATAYDLAIAASPERTLGGGENRLAVAGGFLEATDDFCDRQLPSVGKKDVALAVFDADDRCRWTRSFGSPESEEVLDVGIDPEGALVLYVHLSGAVEIDGQMLGAAGIGSCFLLRFDQDGELDWSLPVPAPGCDYVSTWDGGPIINGPGGPIEHLEVDGSGAIYFHFASMGGNLGHLVIAEQSSLTAIVAKVSSAGEALWALDLAAEGVEPGAGETFGHDLTVDSTGNVFFTVGIARGPVRLPSGTELGAGVFLLAIDSEGGDHWSQSWTGALVPRDIAAAAGGVHLLTLGYDDILAADEAAVHALTNDGSVSWLARAASGDLDLFDLAVEAGAAGDVIVAGAVGGVATAADESASITPFGARNIFLARLDRDANPVWGHFFPGYSLEDLAVSGHGRIYVAAGNYYPPADFGGGIVDENGGTYVLGLRP